MNGYLNDSFNLLLTVVLIILNAFFVAAEFALVKVNKSKLKGMERDNNPFAAVAQWLYQRQNMALSACQMGITMASLALGWIGEPALAHLVKPLLEGIGITSEGVLHGVAFTIAFTLITSLHIVIGEQVPKIYAIRRPVPVVGWSAYPLKFFYMLFFPFMWLLDRVTSWILRFAGIQSDGEHEVALTEEEIRASLSIAHSKGELSKMEHQLLDAAFRFDDQVSRQIMLPRSEVIFFNLQDSVEMNMNMAMNSRHTRFPVCNGSLDHIQGVIHIKDLFGNQIENNDQLLEKSRKPIFVPKILPLHRLLVIFQQAKQHLAFVEDEHGTVIGIVTLEQVLEQLVGSVEDEFDSEVPGIFKEATGKFLIDGDVSIEEVNSVLDIDLNTHEAETLSGLLVEHTGNYPEKGQKISLTEGIMAEVVQVKDRRALKVRITLPSS